MPKSRCICTERTSDKIVIFIKRSLLSLPKQELIPTLLIIVLVSLFVYGLGFIFMREPLTVVSDRFSLFLQGELLNDTGYFYSRLTMLSFITITSLLWTWLVGFMLFRKATIITCTPQGLYINKRFYPREIVSGITFKRSSSVYRRDTLPDSKITVLWVRLVLKNRKKIPLCSVYSEHQAVEDLFQECYAMLK